MSGKTDFSKTDDSTQNQSCPLEKAYIVPVRYALDESPTRGGLDDNGDPLEHSAPHGFPDKWHGQPSGYPTLTTRSYTLRQLRDGWLYVYDPSTEELSELAVSGSSFGGAAFLTFDLNQSAQLAYSSMQWTDRIKTRVTEDGGVRSHLMKAVYPAATTLQLTLAKLGTATYWPADCGPIDAFDEAVADLAGKPVDNFESTTTPTRALTAEEQSAGPYPLMSYKAPASAGAYTAVPEPENAFFVALDDTLSIINDLMLQISGRGAELAHFNDQHQQKLYTALQVQSLCGVAIDHYLPDTVLIDPERYLQATRLMYDYLDAQASQLSSSDHMLYIRERRAQGFKEQLAELGATSTPNLNSDEVTEWQSKATSREVDVHFDQAIEYACRTGAAQNRLALHLKHAIDDAVSWVFGKLPPTPEALGLDNTDADQCTALLEFSDMTIQKLSLHQNGKAQVQQACAEASGLIGLAPYNFSPAIQQALAQISKNFVNTGTAEGEEESAIPSISTFNNVAGRTNELSGILGLAAVRNSSIYQAMAPTAQAAFDTLATVVQGSAKQAWNNVTLSALASVQAASTYAKRAALSLVNSVLLANLPEGAQGIQLNRDFKRQQQAWLTTFDALEGERLRNKALLRHASDVQEAQGYRADLEAAKEKLKLHAFEYPGLVTPVGEVTTAATAKQLYQQGLEAGSRRFAERAGQFAASKGGWLPLTVAALNLFNFAISAKQAMDDGRFDKEEQLTFLSNGAYTANAMMMLWMGPFWEKYAGTIMEVEKNGQAVTLVQKGVDEWLDKASSLKGEAATKTADSAKIANSLRYAVAGAAIFGLVATSTELYQTINKWGSSNNQVEGVALKTKGISLGVMSAANGAQLIGAAMGRWFAFGWVMGAWATWTLGIAGVVYLIASYFYNRYHQEGLRLWLSHSQWGTNPRWNTADTPASSSTDAVNANYLAEQQAFRYLVLRPSLVIAPVTVSRGAMRNVKVLQGCWVRLIFPKSLSGHTVTVPSSASLGRWVRLDGPNDPLKGFPSRPPSDGIGRSVRYTQDDTLRIWEAWVDQADITYLANSVLPCFEVNYPAGLFNEATNAQGYYFKLDTGNLAYRSNFSLEPETEVMNHCTPSISLHIPEASE